MNISIEDIHNLEELRAYLDKHTAVKSSLLNDVVDKIFALTNSEALAAEIIIEYRFFSKISEVVTILDKQRYTHLRKAVIDISINQGRISLLEHFENRNLLEDADIGKFFNQPRSIVDYLVCLRDCSVHSRIYSQAVYRLDKHVIDDSDLLILLNALNQILYGENSLLLSLQYQDLFNYFFFGALIDEQKEVSPSLKKLRQRILKKSLRQIKEPYKIHFLTDLIKGIDLKEDFESSLNDTNLLKWFHFEQSLKSEFEIGINLNSALQVSSIYETENFEEIWNYYSNAESSTEIYTGFCVLKLYLFQIHYSNQTDDLVYAKLLNDSLMAYYLNGLYKLNIINKVPAMNEIFNWPIIYEVRAYINRFEGDFYDHSPLSLIGYTVKENSDLTLVDRQYILKRAFIDSNFSYLNHYNWGYKGTPKRLKCIASHLAMLIRNARRQSRNMEQAIERWEKDLEYMKKEFYDDRCAAEFHWSEVNYYNQTN